MLPGKVLPKSCEINRRADRLACSTVSGEVPKIDTLTGAVYTFWQMLLFKLTYECKVTLTSQYMLARHWWSEWHRPAALLQTQLTWLTD